MKIKYFLVVLLAFILTNCQKNKASKNELIHKRDSIYIKDFNQYWKILDENFAYFDTRKTDWDKVKASYQPFIDTLSNKISFITLLEKTNNELYNGHVGLHTNNQSSSKLIPTASDLWISYKNKSFLIESIRENSRIEKSEIKVGMEILKYNGVNINDAIKEFLPKSFKNYDTEVYEFAVNMLLAGKHNIDRSITVEINDKNQNIKLPYSDSKHYYPDNEILSSKTMEGAIGYIRINNSLGNNELINKFDEALDALLNTKALILDLRETPSGGNNTIAKAIMGRFIKKEKPYQRYRYVLDEKETGVKQIWTELVIPRKEMYSKPLILLVGRWTGSMGEGITIGFDSFKRAEIVGTKMAGLLGGIWNYKLNETGIGFQIPGIKVYHINKTPREQFVPKNEVTNNSEYMYKAKELLNETGANNEFKK